MDEFLLTRRGEPFLFILGPFGATWMNEEILFRRPLEKLGTELALLHNGEVIDASRPGVTKVAAHWKKQLNRRLRKLQELRPAATLSELIYTGPFQEENHEPTS